MCSIYDIKVRHPLDYLSHKRNDDNMDVLRKRFRTFQEETMPIITYYTEKNQVKNN